MPPKRQRAATSASSKPPAKRSRRTALNDPLDEIQPASDERQNPRRVTRTSARSAEELERLAGPGGLTDNAAAGRRPHHPIDAEVIDRNNEPPTQESSEDENELDFGEVGRGVNNVGSNVPPGFRLRERSPRRFLVNSGMQPRHPWANSTAHPARPQDAYNANVSNANFNVNDASERFAEVLERTLNSVREASMSEGNSRLVNRLTTAKSLPSFSGDPLEWLHFKEAYQLSSELGGYNNSEKMSRLFQALKGEAREVVGTLLATCREAETVMSTLELHYGNKHTVAEKIVNDLKNLPSIDSGKVTLTQFATKFRNAIIAFKSLDLIGYLHSPEICKLVGNKLPSALKFEYNRYASTATGSESALEKLGNLLYKEAELAAAAGIFDIDVNATTSTLNNSNNKRDTRDTRSGAVFAAQDVNESSDNRRDKNYPRVRDCMICMKGKHFPSECEAFAQEAPNKRWSIARKLKLCFGCLKTGHAKSDCRNAKCSVCARTHHTLLHHEPTRGFGHTNSDGAQSGSAPRATTECVNVASASHDSDLRI